ncbi:MAG: DMT family transporter [Candidatus Cloacimonadaceae bacterium]|nr:DMT family transporter [Candidatus Cloacimonadota bacterium]MDD3103181.1 DMT family transporter [Candidatus Cloacimonadota bacterium]MDD3532487.1 DMT family transporter [Candidatus Cloacimonadota bacterium]MDY0126950.1 DMT family transporter [Candidatus Cloacimonadaceae bacterium]
MKLKSHLYCLIAICIWSSLELAGKFLGEGISPFAITAWRFLIGGACIAPFAVRAWTQNKIKIAVSSILKLGLLGILNVVISMLLLQWAIYYGKASLVAVIVSMNPLFVSLFALLLLKEKLNRFQVYSLFIGLIGLIIIILGEKELLQQNFINLPLGIVFAVLAGITFALYTVLTKWAVSQYGNLITNSVSFLFGGIVLSAINLIIGKSMSFVPSWHNIWLILYLGVIVTGLAYLLYFEGMKQLSAAKASFYFFLKPALATLLAYFFLGEQLSALQIGGIVLIMLALSRRFWFSLYERNKLKA